MPNDTILYALIRTGILYHKKVALRQGFLSFERMIVKFRIEGNNVVISDKAMNGDFARQKKCRRNKEVITVMREIIGEN